MAYRVRFINKIVFIVMIFWTLLVLSVGSVFTYMDYSYADKLAKNEALVSVKKDFAYRSWVSSHGGVYVPITKKTPPNPYLKNIQNRDVNTTANQQLTLMNPAYTLSQMMKDYSDLYGTKGHITSLILTNPLNKPDAWEEKALKEQQRTRKSIFVKTSMDGEEYLRYIEPLETKKSCLKCHGSQGYKVGDIRGAVSVSIPMKKYYDDAFLHGVIKISIIAIIYLVGVIVIFYGRKKAREIVESKIKDYEQHIFSLVNIIEKRDSYTAGHTQRVANYSVLIAKEMGFHKDKIDDLYRACMLHDIGKISTPDSILLKPGKLNSLEYEIIKEHVVVSYELLNKVDIYKDIAEIVRHHHERYDGSGYPQGLKDGQIPILSQIMSVADAFDAMTTNRIYKIKKDVHIALKELQELSGKEFNAQVVNAACIALKNLEVEETITQRPKSKIEKERFAYFYKDRVTDVYNREYLDFVLANNKNEFNMQCINGIYLQNFSQYNREHGWEEGDKLLQRFANDLKEHFHTDYVFRIYGDDFIVLVKKHEHKYLNLENLEEKLKDTGVSIINKHFDIQASHIHSFEDLERLF